MNGRSIASSLAVTAALLVAAGVVRFVAALDDFWFDETWSWSMTLQLSSPWSILTNIRHDNNHYLNTWLIYVIGRDASWLLYEQALLIEGVELKKPVEFVKRLNRIMVGAL